MSDVIQKNQQIVALFSKALTDSLTEPPKERTNASNWVVLGYFDMLQIYSISEQKDMLEICSISDKKVTLEDNGQEGKWLSNIRRHNISIAKSLCGQHYLHALHLLAAETEDDRAGNGERKRSGPEKQNDSQQNMPYLCLTLVQGATIAGEDGSVVLVESEQLREIVEREQDDSVTLHCYHTMELSDLVIIWQSNSFHAIMEKISNLYEKVEVGDISTFPAVEYDYLIAEGWKNCPQNNEDSNIFVSSKYIVKEADRADDYFKCIGRKLSAQPSGKGHVYFTVGLEDLHYIQEEVRVRDYLEQLRLRFVDKDVKDLFKRAFYECTTQIGIHREIRCEQNQEDAAIPPVNKYIHPLAPRCDKMLEEFQKRWTNLGSWMGPRGYSWMKATSNLLNALTDMSRNWVMDGFCYLIADAARMFCEDIIEWVDNKSHIQLTDKDLEQIHRFIRGWGSLMEQATRIDGRYMQMPGFSPALCEIPARLLEFYLAFTKSCANLIDAESDVALLLAPKICRRIKVESIVDNKIRNLLYVDIPMDLLYEQTAVLCSLCHEVSHFVGERWRCRETRRDHLIYVTANELLISLEMVASNTAEKLFDKLRECCGSDSLYANELLAHLISGIKYVLTDDKFYDTLYTCYVDEQKIKWVGMERNLWEARNALRKQSILNNAHELEIALEHMMYLFRECYADISMIYLLKTKQDDYFELAAREWETLKIDCPVPKRDSRYFVFLERVATVLNLKCLWAENTTSAWIDKRERDEEQKNTGLQYFVKDIKACLVWINVGIKECDDQFNSRESMRSLQDYLQYCYKTIDGTFKGDTEKSIELKRIRELYETVSSQKGADYEKYEECINKYRDTMI